MRYRLENICLVGIIPGPREPELTVNSYIDPLVEDLLQLWKGVDFCVATSSERKLVCAALICASCDLPAGRKLCGFLGHSARLGCSRCKKEFPGSVGSMNYSGFDRADWIPRTGTSHRKDAEELLLCSTKTELKRKESNLGCRYSSLLKLPYFDPPRMLAIDPMHNLFLGIAKHHLQSVWIKREMLGDVEFKLIQERVDKMVVPCDIGRLPVKILSGFSSFTADQFKNWVIHYSIIALHGLLSSNDIECWRTFVLGSRILCSQSVTTEKVKLADLLLLQFCRRTQRQYGEELITPNLHLSCHLCECVLDFGPLHSFWCFAFERYNGILGQFPNNNRSIEIQMMKHFLNDTDVFSLANPVEFRDDFSPLLKFEREPVGSLADCTSDNPALSVLHQQPDWSIDSPTLSSSLILPRIYTRCAFTPSQIDCLKELYSALYSVPSSELYIPTIYQQYSSVVINGKVLGSHKSRSHSSSIVMAEWNSQYFGAPNIGGDHEVQLRPVRINFFCKHAVTVHSSNIHVIVSVSWFKYHPCKDICGKPVTVWEPHTFELSGAHSFIPVQFIKFRTVSLIDTLSSSSGSALFVSPFPECL